MHPGRHASAPAPGHSHQTVNLFHHIRVTSSSTTALGQSRGVIDRSCGAVVRRRWGQGLEAAQADITRILTAESGKPSSEANVEYGLGCAQVPCMTRFSWAVLPCPSPSTPDSMAADPDSLASVYWNAEEASRIHGELLPKVDAPLLACQHPCRSHAPPYRMLRSRAGALTAVRPALPEWVLVRCFMRAIVRLSRALVLCPRRIAT